MLEDKQKINLRIRFVKRFGMPVWRMFCRYAIKREDLREVDKAYLLQRVMTRSAIRYWLDKFK